MILSICICSLVKRIAMLGALTRHLESQIEKFPDQVELVIETDNGEMTTGAKRNLLIQKATGKYICFVDDDDWVSDWYVEEIIKAVETDPDTVGINGWMSTDGKNIESWAISIFNPYMTTKKLGRNYYLRFANHLSPVRREIAVQYPFPDISSEEDYAYANAMHEANALKTEVLISKPMYEYRYKKNKDV